MVWIEMHAMLQAVQLQRQQARNNPRMTTRKRKHELSQRNELRKKQGAQNL